MKALIVNLAVSIGFLAGAAQAEEMVNVGGKEFPLSVLTKNCQSMSDDPQAMIACFNALSKLMEGGSGAAAAEDTVSVEDAFEDFQQVAQFKDNESGLMITGEGCKVHLIYYANYFHISRRNVSSIDLYSAQFDVSKLQYDQVVQVAGGPGPLSKGQLDNGAVASMVGGIGLDSAKMNFPPKSARSSIDEYAIEVAGQLAPREGQTFDFVMVHPGRSDDSDDIWKAFKTFASVCKSQGSIVPSS